MKIKTFHSILVIGLALFFACGPSEEEKQEAIDKKNIEEGNARRAKEDSLRIANRPNHIASENLYLQNRGVKSITICTPINGVCTLWAPNVMDSNWHETNIRYDNAMEKTRRFLHVIENTSEWKNRDTANYYLVAFFRDLENAPPDLNIGFVRKGDVRVE